MAAGGEVCMPDTEFVRRNHDMPSRFAMLNILYTRTGGIPSMKYENFTQAPFENPRMYAIIS
jgi:hypothetical protein